MKCRANNSVQRRDYKRQKNEITDKTLAFCSHANFLTLTGTFGWSLDRCEIANAEMNKQFNQIIRNNMALNDYSAILKQDYHYKTDKVRANIIKAESDNPLLAERWLTELKQVCYHRYITVAVVVLRDKFGWGSSMCDKYQSAMNRWLSKYTRGEETLETMNRKLNERGINLTCGSARDKRCG